MEAKKIEYSLKNKPIQSKQHYLKSMIDKAESFITRLRWKENLFEKPDQPTSNNSTNFCFKSNVTLKSLPLSKMDFMIWCVLSNLNLKYFSLHPKRRFK